MSQEEPYVPLSERVKQDVWHDNFVPKYSAIASAQPTKLFLCGVWLIFAPIALVSVIMILAAIQSERRVVPIFLMVIWPVVGCVLSTLILFMQTRRFLTYRAEDEA